MRPSGNLAGVLWIRSMIYVSADQLGFEIHDDSLLSSQDDAPCILRSICSSDSSLRRLSGGCSKRTRGGGRHVMLY